MFDEIPISTIELPEGRFQTFPDISLHESRTALRIKHSKEEQALTYRMSCEINTPYAGEYGILLLRKGKFVIWKMKSSRLSWRKGAADRPFRSTGVNPSRKQRCCSQSCLLFQAQRDTSDQDNYENIYYWLTIRHRCVDMWSWTEMLTVSFQRRAKTVWIPIRMSTEICRLGEGHNWYQLKCRLSVGKPFPRRPRKCCRLETLACWLCHLQYTCF